MGLSQSLYTGYSGMFTHQRSMDNIGHNLANVNTTGYKKSDFMFNSLFKQAIHGAMPADGDRAAYNGKSVGMGVTTGAIVGNFQTSAPEHTGNPLDCAITGNGFFMVSTPQGTALTRNGSFYQDHTGDANRRLLCVGDGLPVQGWVAQDGVINPSQTIGNIYLPAKGDKLPGRVSTEVDIKGILPSQVTGSDFSGMTTNQLELKGNLPVGDASVFSTIYMPTTQSGGSQPTKDVTQPVNVRIDFTGPVLSEDGQTNSYGWTMTTVDWPTPGAPGVQIYPPMNGGSESVNFHVQGSTDANQGAGQALTETITPGSTRVESSYVNEFGETISTYFDMPPDFRIDTSRLTRLDNAPGGNALETWYVNGNPTGTMARTIDVFDEYTTFEPVTGENGVTTMQAVRSAETRRNTMFFRRDANEDNGSVWSWQSSIGGDSGTLSFDMHGELTGSQQQGGRIAYNFSDIKTINHEGTLQASAQDGYRDGFMTGDVTIDGNGKIWAHYSNNVDVSVAQIAMGNVPNTSGLSGVSGLLFYPSVASGEIMVGIAGDASGNLGLPPIGAGALLSNNLETSNVELSREFTNMISVERGYQFNSRIITTANEMLQTALQLK